MNLSKNDLNQLLFSFSLFLYPISLINHSLYLVPQFLLLLNLIIFSKFKINILNLVCMGLALFSSIICFYIEFFSFNFSLDLPVKLFLNNLSLIVILFTGGIVFNALFLKYIKIMLYLWLFIVIYIYITSGGVSQFIPLLSTLIYGGDLNSSQLYNTAEPLSKFFLTKNITAMFFVAIFSLYIVVIENFNSKKNKFYFIIFFLLIFLFFSRQAILSYLVVVLLYFFSISNFLIRCILSILGVISLFYIFLKLFNLDNSGDGASQRLELWAYFFNNFTDFILFGLGQLELSNILYHNVGIDNFHMFFMNQIGAYGLFHFLSFNIFLILLYKISNYKFKFLLFLVYFLNVSFQTFGYEFGNLFTFMMLICTFKSKYSDNIRGV